MNSQQPYEKYLADKLQELPLPDVEPKWQQMRTLLDKEMPRRGGYWKWVTLVGVIILVSVGIREINLLNAEGITTRHSSGSTKPTTSSDPKREPANASRGITAKQKKIAAPLENPSDQATARLKKTIKKTNVNDEILQNENNTVDNKVAEQSNNQRRKIVLHDLPVIVENHPVGDSKAGNSKIRGLEGSENSTSAKITGTPENLAGTRQHPIELDEPAKSSALNFQRQSNVTGIDVNIAIGDSIDQENYPDILRDAKAMVKQPSAKRTVKSGKPKNIYAGENKNMALGFSLPLGFPLGDQKPGAYNINARPNTITDFLPVPHLQYHVNNKVYLQTELQLINPQFIQPVLLYQDHRQIMATNTVHYNSIYAKKLYYFNLPVAIHYSPFEHFFLGTGLQFSSFVSGVAMQEVSSSVTGSGRYTVLSQHYSKFKNDTLSRKIDDSEFRLMLDANYYWKKFTVGLRYNQAFSNYVSFRLNNVSPLFQDKNKSLQFYLRYNLWENQKKIPFAKSEK